jgi:hypothetical protein
MRKQLIGLFGVYAILGAHLAAGDSVQTVTLKDYLGHTWSDELISYPLDKDLASAKSVQVKDEAGAVLPNQLQDGRVYLLVTLPSNSVKTLTISAGEAGAAPAKPAKVTDEGGLLTLDSGAMSLRLPSGEKTYPTPTMPKDVAGPLCGVRGAAGTWIGKSWLDAPLKVTGYKSAIAARGPLFAEASVEYMFEGGKRYRFTARVIAGQPVAVIDETMDLNPGGIYAMLSYNNDADASSWEWWNLADSAHMDVGKATAEQPANAVFSFYDNLKPNQCRWMGGRPTHPRKGVDAQGKPTVMVESGELYAPLTYEQDERFNRLTGWWLNSFSDRSYVFSMLNESEPASPVVSLIMGRPSKNVNPNLNPSPEPWVKLTTGINDMRINTKKAGDLQVLAPIGLGTREWLLMVEPQSALRPKGDADLPNAYKTMLKISYFPLDKIKDWVFDWAEPKNAWPRLFCKAGDMQAMKERVALATGPMAASPQIPVIYRTNGTPAKMVSQALPFLQQKVKDALSGTGHGGMNWFHASLHMMQLMPVWEAAMATPGIDPAARARIKAYGAFIAQRAWDEDYWPSKETCNGWGSANMGVLASGARVLTAAAMAGHPNQKAWLKRCPGYLDGNMPGTLAEDGSGVSCPHYLGASLDPIMYMALALKYGGNYNVFKKDPRWPKYSQFMIDILTPPDLRSPLAGSYAGLPLGAKLDPTTRNRRNLWPLGHTSRTEPTGLLDMLALGMEGVNEPLAGALRVMAMEMGQAAGGAFVPYALLQNTTSKLVAPDLRTRWYPSYGAILRDRMTNETWFAIRYSMFAFDHFQADTGAFTLFAKGVPLMMDFGSMYAPENGQPVYHNRVAWDVKEGEARPCPGNQSESCFYGSMTYFVHTNEPWTCKTEGFGEGQSPTDSFGEIKSFASLPTADFLFGETVVKTLQTLPYFPNTPEALSPDPNQKRILETVTPFAWQRRVLFAKALTEKDPQYVVVRDDFTAPCPPPTISYWIMGTNVQLTGNRAYVSGQFGVDLDLFTAMPADPKFTVWGWGHKNWGGETQQCVRVTQPEGRPVLTVLYPRRPDEPAPEFASVASGNGVKITVAGETQWAFVSPTVIEFKEGDLAFSGTAGVARRMADGRVVFTLAAPGKIQLGKYVLESKKPVTKTF